jgi:preprotein translocase subunit SecB
LVLKATFSFDQDLELKDIPDYFYRNSLGIIYPYLRAFVSTITFQANLKPPMILPLFNLTELERSFRENVEEIGI